MTVIFFNREDHKRLMQEYIKNLGDIANESEFHKERNKYIKSMLEYFLSDPKDWDEKTQFNIQSIGDSFIKGLDTQNLNNYFLNYMLYYCLRFALEKSYFHEDDDKPMRLVVQLRQFSLMNFNNFDEITQSQIDFAFKVMPLEITKSFLKNDDVKSYRDFLNCIQEGREFKEKWEKYLTEQEGKISRIHKTLEGYESAFNFVALYDGFKNLGKKKKNEILWSRIIMFALALIIPTPMIYIYFHSPIFDVTQGSADKLITFIPSISLTLILIYFFRVSLSNYNSLRAQIVQIDLRKSLCQFIQNYSEYHTKIKNNHPDSLAKFEDVIFSNIMPLSEKIPSTFDGIEQIASLIASIKPK